MRMRYAIVIEQGTSSYGAYVPDLPGCAATGVTEAEARELIRDAIGLHLEALRNAGAPIPSPSSRVDYVDAPSAA